MPRLPFSSAGADRHGLAAIAREVAAVRQLLEQAQQTSESELVALRAVCKQLSSDLSEHRDHTDAELARLREILQLVYDREPELRERLAQLRRSPGYELAYTDPEPLVSVVIPTHDSTELLVNRSVPSALNQTYGNVEVVVVGDAAPPETGELLAKLGDPRIRYENLVSRGPYPTDARDLWHVAGIPPRNEAVRMAAGRWIAPLDDDDAFPADHVERLLSLARENRAEVAYGRMRCFMTDGSVFELGSFPPRLGQFGWQASIFHAGLRFFEMELADSLFFSPGDWSLCRRMLRAGVRFAMLDDAVVDHYESRFSPRYDDVS